MRAKRFVSDRRRPVALPSWSPLLLQTTMAGNEDRLMLCRSSVGLQALRSCGKPYAVSGKGTERAVLRRLLGAPDWHLHEWGTSSIAIRRSRSV